ncbi:MAG: hypothetical protein ACKORK_04005, partial [Gemmatimonadota bacterium]
VTMRSLRALAAAQSGDGEEALLGALAAADAAGPDLPFARAACLDLAGRIAAAHGLGQPDEVAALERSADGLGIRRVPSVPVAPRRA